MASLALGIAGAVVGSFFGPLGASIGFALGSALGSLISAKDTQGPKLTSLRLQGASYGQMIPYVLGTVRMAGVVVWNPDLVEHSHEESAGKGGPTNTTFTYTASFAVKLCKKPPNATTAIAGILSAWGDNRLVYDTTGSNANNNQIAFTTYRGEATALADPTMETALGVGNVPAFRDEAATVFTDEEMEQFGNRIPSLEWEIFTNGGYVPWRVSTYDRLADHVRRSGIVRNDDGTTTNVLFNYRFTNPNDLITEIRDIDGTLISTTTESIDTYNGMNVFSASQCENNIHILEITAASNSGDDFGAWYFDGELVAHPISGGTNSLVVYYRSVFSNDNVYAIGSSGGNPFISRYQSIDGVTAQNANATYSLHASSSSDNWTVCVSDDGFIYVSDLDGHGRLQKLDTDLVLVHDWGTSGPPVSVYNFVIYRNQICYPHQAITGDYYARLETINNDDTFTFVGECLIAPGDMISVENGLVSVQDGIISLNPPAAAVTLADVITLVSILDGLTEDQIDVTDCPDPVYGVVFAQQGDGRTWLEPILNVFSVAAVESGPVIKFKHIGGDPVVSIPDEDLGAYERGSDPQPLLSFVRTQEVDLPKVVYLSYFNKDAAYQISTQHAQREVTSSEAEITINVPMVMTDAQALAAAWTILMRAWLERDRYTFFTSRKYSHLEPIDVVTIQGKNLRIVTKTDGAGGVLKFEAVPSLRAILDQFAVPAASTGFIPPTLRPTQETVMQLLDIALVDDADSPGFYVAMAGATSGPWRGANLMKSSDGGATYTTVATVNTASVMGTATNALANWTGGNVVDETQRLTVVIGAGGGELSSTTNDGLLAGQNKALYGNEIIQYRDAELVDVDTYDLTGILHGRRGTEWATPAHVDGERFIALPVTSVPMPLSEVGQARLYKAVTIGSPVSSATAVSFTNTGESIRPYTPVQIGGGINGAGDVTINWTRRDRLGSAWSDFVDAPMSETTESYVVQIWNADYSLCAWVETTTAQTFVYTSARQVTDFGAQQLNIFVSIGQVGSYGLGRQGTGTIPGAGASNVNPLVPVNPYTFTPPPSGGGGGCTLPVTTTALAWPTGAHTFAYNSSFATGEVWDIVFTTGAAVAGSGLLQIYEFGSGGPVTRTGTLSTSPCGPPLGSAIYSQITATTLGFYYYMLANPNPTIYPTLAAFTTYHVSVTTTADGGMRAELRLPQ